MKWLDSILKRWKKPEAAPLAEPTRYGYRGYGGISAVADALTPARLISILRAAEDGDITSQCELFEEMPKRDAYLDGLMRQRVAGVSACAYEVQPGDDSAEAAKAVEFIEQIIADIPLYRDKIADVLDAIFKAFSCMEIIWETSEKQWVPTDLLFRPQRWWTLDQTDRNKLLLRDAGNWNGVEVNPLNFITHIHRARSGSIDAAGLALSCARPFVVRGYGMKDWLAFAEVFGMPVRIGKLPQGATDSDRSLMWEALQNLGHDAAGMVPFGAEISFANVGTQVSNGDFFERLRSTAGDEMAICILGQLLSTGGAEGGSYALGKVQQNVRWDLVDSDAYRLDETLSKFYALITRLNFGDGVLPPRHVTTIELPEDLTAAAGVVNVLVGAGLPVGANWCYEKFGIPAPEDGEATLKAPAAPSPFGAGGQPPSPVNPFVTNAVANSSDSQARAPVLQHEKKNFAPAPSSRALARSRAFLR